MDSRPEQLAGSTGSSEVSIGVLEQLTLEQLIDTVPLDAASCDSGLVTSESGLQSYRPTAYLDQWVWIRLARAASGQPDAPGDPELLKALIDAANAGVAFPLSWIHYIETQWIRNPRQRRDVANVMASISHFRTIRSRRDLLRNQLLIAMHEQFGRPTFRPERIDPLGIGVHWALQGVEKVLQVHDADGNIINIDQFPREMRIRATQGFEYQVVAGPHDEEARLLREQYGYKPEASPSWSQPTGMGNRVRRLARQYPTKGSSRATGVDPSA